MYEALTSLAIESDVDVIMTTKQSPLSSNNPEMILYLQRIVLQGRLVSSLLGIATITTISTNTYNINVPLRGVVL